MLAANHDIALDSLDHLAVSRPPLTKHFQQRPPLLPRPSAWSVPAPWALLKETILNLESIDEVEYREASAQTATLLLKTSPGLVFQLELSPLQAVSIQAAVRAQSTFVWDQVNVVELTLPSAVAYPRQYEPREVTFSELLTKWKK